MPSEYRTFSGIPERGLPIRGWPDRAIPMLQVILGLVRRGISNFGFSFRSGWR